jgi:elongation factor 1 alpha-like protein
MSWFNIPFDRRTVFIAPIMRGGLLGGSPEAPKRTKLQALAAARKKKALGEKNGSGSGTDDVGKPTVGLDIAQSTQNMNLSNSSTAASFMAVGKPRSYVELKQKNSSSAKKLPRAEEPVERELLQPEQDLPLLSVIEFTEPSAFASTIIGSRTETIYRQSSSSIFTLPSAFNPFLHSTDAFAGPSPDDVVIAAQSKGSALSANLRK